MNYFVNPPYIKKNKLKYKLNYKFTKLFRNYKNRIFFNKHKNFKLIFTFLSYNTEILKKINIDLFDNIIISNKNQYKLLNKHVNNKKIILIPAIPKEYEIKNKNSNDKKIGGILSPICKSSNIKKSIDIAIKDGCTKIYLFGYMKDPIFYNKEISQIIKNYNGKIKYYNSISKDKIYNLVTDIYDYSTNRATDLLEKECKLLDISLHTENKYDEDILPNLKEIFTTKDIEEDFYKILNKLKNHEHFAFTRYSDGELFILQNKELILDTKFIKIGDKNINGKGYSKEDHKHFDPKEHSFYKNKLVESFQFEKENYYKGISCKCCVKKEDYEWQFENENGLKNTKFQNLTWANLLINKNYERFITDMYPVLTEYKVVFVCNEKADLSSLPFVIKEFKVGYNAMINDYPQIEDIKKWISENNVKDYLFLFAASSFSELAIKELFEFNDQNTYMDIGTALNMFMNMKNDRGYLGEYWCGNFGNDLKRKCIW
jgi:hypothetical protein